jgi:hypothetical protein
MRIYSLFAPGGSSRSASDWDEHHAPWGARRHSLASQSRSPDTPGLRRRSGSKLGAQSGFENTSHPDERLQSGPQPVRLDPRRVQ